MEPNHSSTNYDSGDREVERVTTMDCFWDFSSLSPMYTGLDGPRSEEVHVSPSEIGECPPRTLSLPNERRTISHNNAFSPLQREPPSDLHSPYFAPEALMVINHHSFYNQQMTVPCECMDLPQYFELYALECCWREEIASHVGEIIPNLRLMHGHIREEHGHLFPDPPPSILSAMGHIESVLDYADELLCRFLRKPVNEVADSTFTIRAIFAVDRLTMALQLFVRHFIPHIEELYLQDVFNSTAKRLFAFGLHYNLLWEGHPKLESFGGYHENLLCCPAPIYRYPCENGDSDCFCSCPNSCCPWCCSSCTCSSCSSSPSSPSPSSPAPSSSSPSSSSSSSSCYSSDDE